ncbi:flagellar outer dynein arm intermediate chain 1 [Pycnococcus provasolii]
MPPKKAPKKGAKTPEPSADDDAAPAPAPAPAPAADDFLLPQREVVVPDNQLGLTAEELDEEFAKMITANNPNAPRNVARYNFKERQFKFEAVVEQLVTQYETEGWMLHKASDEAKRQIDLEKLEKEALENYLREAEKPKDGEEGDDSKQLRNQFNFSERAASTSNNPLRDRATMTDPPPTVLFSANANQWEIYDAYMEDQERQRLQREIKKRQEEQKKRELEEDDDESEVKKAPEKKKEETSVMHGKKMSRATRVLERMVNQNSFSDIAQDFKYWDDASDAFREGEGTLLPLWKFYNDRAKRKHVTSMCWNPEYLDLFAVGYGSFDFMKQSSGLVCCYSLKNPSHPEYTFTTESGVMALDFHPQHANLLAVGLYDGTVAVFDVRNKLNKPIYMSTVKTGKHTDPVWQVSWAEEDMSKNLSFYSVSSDGRVTMWEMSKSELAYQNVMELRLTGSGSSESNVDDDSVIGSLAGGCSFDFNKVADHLFVVGTEEGRIHKCSKAYSSQYLQTYEGHHMAVYGIRWNNKHSRVFISASADWTCKLWDHQRAMPVMSFDLNNSVGDVAWSPYSSTTFAACTSDGKVHVYDLAENKHEPMCEQKIVRKAKLTRILFNPKYPILIVGDDRGCVTSLKLSPNLRKTTGGDDDAEMKKLDGIMDLALKGEYISAEADAV